DGSETYKATAGDTSTYIIGGTYAIINDDQAKSFRTNKYFNVPSYCTFLAYGQNQKFVARQDIIVTKQHRSTNCNAILGTSGVSFRGQPALLAIVQYFWTHGDPAHSVTTIGTNWIQTAVLLPLKRNPKGQWTLTQNFSSFNPDNHIA